MRNERKLVISLTGDEFDHLAARADARQIRLAEMVRQMLSVIAMSNWTPLMSAAAERAIASAPTTHLPQVALRPGSEDLVETVLRSTSPAEQATRSALAMLVRFDPESCFLEAGTWLLSALLAHAALDPDYSPDRALTSIYREVEDETSIELIERLRHSIVANGYIAENARLLARKRPIERMYIRQHVAHALEESVYYRDLPGRAEETAHIAITVSTNDYAALLAISLEQTISLSMLGRAAVARLLHMRPHLALVPNERGDG